MPTTPRPRHHASAVTGLPAPSPTPPNHPTCVSSCWLHGWACMPQEKQPTCVLLTSMSISSTSTMVCRRALLLLLPAFLPAPPPPPDIISSSSCAAAWGPTRSPVSACTARNVAGGCGGLWVAAPGFAAGRKGMVAAAQAETDPLACCWPAAREKQRLQQARGGAPASPPPRPPRPSPALPRPRPALPHSPHTAPRARARGRAPVGR